MNSVSRRLVVALVMLAAQLPGAWAQQADKFPNKPIKLIVPFAAGSATDVVARQVSPKASEYLGQTIVIENRAGASGTLGAGAVARSAPDGYTILFGTAPSNAIAPSVDKNLSYDPIKDFAPVIGVSTAPYVLAVSSTVPVHTVKELIAYAAARPGQLNYASTGNGTGVQLAGALFARKASLDIKHIPYNNSGQMTTDMASGTVQMIFYPHQGLLPLIQSGKVRVLASSGAKRLPQLADIPTMVEAGVPDFTLASWQAIYAPAGTSPDRVRTLFEAFRKALLDTTVAASVVETGSVVQIFDPEELGTFTRNEVEAYKQIVQASVASK